MADRCCSNQHKRSDRNGKFVDGQFKDNTNANGKQGDERDAVRWENYDARGDGPVLRVDDTLCQKNWRGNGRSVGMISFRQYRNGFHEKG